MQTVLLYEQAGQADKREDLKLNMSTRREQVASLRDSGLSYAEIGRIWGISGERVRQILNWKPIQKPDLQSKVMLRVGDVAQLLGLHSNTVRRWSEKGVLKSHRFGSRGDRRFLRKDIDEFLKETEIDSESKKPFASFGN